MLMSSTDPQRPPAKAATASAHARRMRSRRSSRWAQAPVR